MSSIGVPVLGCEVREIIHVRILPECFYQMVQTEYQVGVEEQVSIARASKSIAKVSSNGVPALGCEIIEMIHVRMFIRLSRTMKSQVNIVRTGKTIAEVCSSGVQMLGCEVSEPIHVRML